ncbi:MAG: TonB-dependent receptor [Hyphomonadaceae bacterium]|nr:TonB-dependent receptor [Hyphomonadaceae bacterium]
MSRRFWLFAAAAGAAISANSQAIAQDATGEIVVTATRRESALQDVPIAVTPITADAVQNSGIKDLQDLTSVVPALQFNVSENETSATARLRGVGTQGSNPGLESAVGIFIDGVYRARNGVALTDLGEVKQIEVLRGPQGTLFGRNTSAGLITVQTAGPDLNDFSATGEVTYGEFGETRVSGSVNVPMAEDVAGFRLFAARATRDGFMNMNPAGPNPLLGAESATNRGKSEDNDRDVWTFRGQFLWALTEDFEVRLIGDFSKREETCCAAQIYDPVKLNGHPTTVLLGPPNPLGVEGPALLFGQGRQQLAANLGAYGGNVSASTPLGALGAGLQGDRTGFGNRTYDQNLEDWGFSGEVTWHLSDDVTLTSVSAYRNWQYGRGSDSDYSQADLTYVPAGPGNQYEFGIFTQEFRLAGTAGPLDWLVGMFYADEKIDYSFEFRTGAQYGAYWASLDSVLAQAAISYTPTPGLGVPASGGGAAAGLYNALALVPAGSGHADHHVQTGNSLAFFTHNIWSITDSTDLTVGVRYTTEEKDLDSTFRTSFSAQSLFLATVQGLAVGNGLPANALDGLATCNTAVAAPSTLASAFALLRSGYCLPWLRNNLDALGYNQSREEKEWSGVVSLRQELADNVSAYASVSRGYKGGGFNLDRDFGFVVSGGSPRSAFDAEFVDAYEVGLKTNWFGRSLMLNLAVFKNEYENFQLNTFNGVQFVVTTVPEATSEGVEVDVMWRLPIEGLSFQGGAAYTDATYGPDTGWVNANRNPITGEPTLARLPGSHLTNAPEWTATGALTFERQISENLMGLAYVDARWVDDQNTGSDLRPSKLQPAYTLVNARLGVSTLNQHLAFEVWARNVTNEDYAQIMFDVPLQGGGTNGPTQGAFLGDPRTFGATLRFRY